MEYFNDVSNGALLPKNEWMRAQHRLLISKVGEFIGCLWKLYSVNKESLFDKAIEELQELYRFLDSQLEPSYEYEMDKQNLLACSYAPILYKSILVEEYSGRSLFPNCRNLLNWRDSLVSRSSFLRTIPDDYSNDTKAFISKQTSFLANTLESQLEPE